MNKFAWPTVVAEYIGPLVRVLNSRMKGLEYFLAKWTRTADTGASAQEGYVLDDAFLELDELSGDPDAPGSNHARLYLTDTGGKTQLVVRFPTGAVQQIAVEP